MGYEEIISTNWYHKAAARISTVLVTLEILQIEFHQKLANLTTAQEATRSPDISITCCFPFFQHIFSSGINIKLLGTEQKCIVFRMGLGY